MEPIKLPSGAELKITLSEFKVARTLLEALSRSVKEVKIKQDEDGELDFNSLKEMFLGAISSPEILGAILKCAERATYNGVKISESIFENEDARQDYISVLFEVTKANISPFLKGLYAKYEAIVEKILSAQK